MRARVGLGVGVVATVLGTLPALAAGNPAAGGSRPANPIKHIVVLMQEKRAAAPYSGQLQAQAQPAYAPEPTTGNPDPLHSGQTIVPFHKTRLCETTDLNH